MLDPFIFSNGGRREIEEFTEIFQEGKIVRDMLEHDGEYIIGRGRNQTEYRKDLVVDMGQLKIKGLIPFTVLFSD